MKHLTPWHQVIVLVLTTLIGLNGCTTGKVVGTSALKADRIEAELTFWPLPARHIIATTVASVAAGTMDPFATFDADGTIWSSDATESFIAYLEVQGILTPDHLEPALKLVPFLPGEGVYSYYQRLCAKDKAIGYPWCAQAFAGFTLAELRRHYAAMMKTPGCSVRVWTVGEDGRIRTSGDRKTQL